MPLGWQANKQTNENKTNIFLSKWLQSPNYLASHHNSVHHPSNKASPPLADEKLINVLCQRARKSQGMQVENGNGRHKNEKKFIDEIAEEKPRT